MSAAMFLEGNRGQPGLSSAGDFRLTAAIPWRAASSSIATRVPSFRRSSRAPVIEPIGSSRTERSKTCPVSRGAQGPGRRRGSVCCRGLRTLRTGRRARPPQWSRCTSSRSKCALVASSITEWVTDARQLPTRDAKKSSQTAAGTGTRVRRMRTIPMSADVTANPARMANSPDGLQAMRAGVTSATPAKTKRAMA